VGRQDQPRGAQVHVMQCNAMQLSDQKGCSQDPPLLRPYLRVNSGGKGNLLEYLANLRPFGGKQIYLFVCLFVMAVAFEQILICCSLGPRCSAVITVLSIMLQLSLKLYLWFGKGYVKIVAQYKFLLHRWQ